LLAIFVLATGVQGLELVSGAVWLSQMFNGVALILAVALSVNRGASWRSRRQLKGKSRQGPPSAGSAVTHQGEQPDHVTAQKVTETM
jgi:ribose transport system permease protein